MKIVVSTSGNTNDCLLDARFGRCEYFMVYNSDDQSCSFIENEGAQASGGAGIKAANQVVNEKAEVVITGNLGPNALEVLEKSGIKSYSCQSIAALKAIEMFQSQQLSEISIAGNAHHGM